MNSHAALCIAASMEEAHLPGACMVPGADVHHEITDVLQIDTVRTLRTYAYQAPIQSSYRWIVIFARQYTHPAQNALLKVLEEPPVSTKIILVAPSAEQLLPTVRSRLTQIASSVDDSGDTADSGKPTAAVSWLSASVAERLEAVAKMHKQNDSAQLGKLLTEVSTTAAFDAQLAHMEYRRLLNDVVLFAQRSGASKKYLLEALAVTLPIVSFDAEVIH